MAPNQLQAIGLLVSGFSCEETARRVGVCSRTLRRWKKDPEFAEELRDVYNEFSDDMKSRALNMVNRSMNMTQKSFDALDELLEGGVPAQILRASNTLISASLRWTRVLNYTSDWFARPEDAPLSGAPAPQPPMSAPKPPVSAPPSTPAASAASEKVSARTTSPVPTGADTSAGSSPASSENADKSGHARNPGISPGVTGTERGQGSGARGQTEGVRSPGVPPGPSDAQRRSVDEAAALGDESPVVGEQTGTGLSGRDARSTVAAGKPWQKPPRVPFYQKFKRRR